MLPAAVGKTINVACGESFDLLQLMDGINKALGTNVKPIFEPARSAMFGTAWLISVWLGKFLKYEPKIGFDEGLRRTVEYYKSAKQGK